MVVIDDARQVKAWDEASLTALGVSALELMEQAATAFVIKFAEDYPLRRTGDVHVYVGPGGNGGDGLAIARLLENRGYATYVHALWREVASCTAEVRTNWQRLQDMRYSRLVHLDPEALLPDEQVLDNAVAIDAMFGVGLSRPLGGSLAKVAEAISSGYRDIVSVDTPSGISADGSVFEPAVEPTRTYTFQAPKLAALLPDTGAGWGTLHVLDIGLPTFAAGELGTRYRVLRATDVAAGLQPRKPFTFKNTYGHVLILAGSRGKAGAALMSGVAAYRAGCGLVTFVAPTDLVHILQIGLPEAMVVCDPHTSLLTQVPDLSPYDAIVVGPGIGTSHATGEMLGELFGRVGDTPLVVDADALNLIAARDDLRAALPQQAVLTPHPGEFERLAGASSSSLDRLARLEAFAKTTGTTVVLKGRYTTIAKTGEQTVFNVSGNPGMATGGMGDTLTGIIAAALATEADPYEAACLGVLLHGTAGDIAAEQLGYEALLATDVSQHLGAAYRRLREELSAQTDPP